MLSEISQTQKDKHCMMSSICGNKKTKTFMAENRMAVNGGWRGKNGEVLVKGYRVCDIQGKICRKSTEGRRGYQFMFT